MKRDTAVYIAIAAIPIAAFGAFMLYSLTKPAGAPAPDMKGYIFDANVQSCGCCGGE